jgi:hypothetical protein
MIHPPALRALLFSCVGLLFLCPADAVGAPKRVFNLKGTTNGATITPNSVEVVRARLDGNPVTGRKTAVDRKSFSALTSVSEGQEIEIPLAAGQTATGIVNLVHHESGFIRVGGHLTSEKGSFSLSLGRDIVAGMVHLEKKGTTFKVETEKDGSATIRETLRSEVMCYPLPRPDRLPAAAAPRDPEQAVPILDSRPGTLAVLYLDFDGETVTDPDWNNGRTIVGPAARLSNAQITEVWQRVKEDYWPFNISITTDLTRYQSAPVGHRMRCIITANDAAAPGAGGVAYLFSFAEAGTSFSTTIPCWVFIDNDAKACAEAVSHELGHTFGLRHDGRITPPEEYFAGHGSGNTGWAPIMGVGYYRNTVQWSKGEYQSANNHEDDLAIISNATNAFGYVPDETPDVLEGAIPLTFNAGAVQQEGVITKSTDVDFFVFSTTGGTIDIAANGATPSPNLDILLQLLDSSGTILATSNPTSALNATISRDIPAGDYFLRIEGTGVGDVLTTGYSKYASIGAYTLTGTIPGGSSSPIPVITSTGVLSGLRGIPVNYQIKATGNPTSYGVTGPIPAWMNFDALTGVLSGTPPTSGNFALTISATNASGTGSRDLVVTINVGAVSLETALDTTGYVWLSGGDDEWLGELDVSFDGVDGAESGPITDGQSTFLETTVQGPGVVRFHWRTDSEADGDILHFSIDAVEKKQLSGQTGWVEDSFSFPAGSHTLRWEYTKNASVSVGLDHGWVDTVSVTLLPLPVITSATSVIGEQGEVFQYRIEADNLPTSFGLTGPLPDGLMFDTATGIISGIPTGPAIVQLTMSATNDAGTTSATLNMTITPPILTLGESVNAENLDPWVTTGSQLWIPQTVVSADGMDAAQSGPIVHGQSTQLAATIIGPTAVRFKWKVSSELKFDFLELLIDGIVQGSISGDVDWQEVVYPIPAGRHTVAWRYRKDSSINAGADAAWLDQVRLDSAPLMFGSGIVAGRINEPFFYRVAAVNLPVTFDATGLPPGLSLNTSSGIINGTPTALGTYPINLTLTNASGTEMPALTIIINQTRGIADLLRPSTYTGLIRHSADGRIIGMATLKVAAKQAYTGTIVIGRIRYPFKGKLDLLHPRIHQLKVPGGENLTVTLTLDSRADVDLVTGSVQGGSGTSGFEAFGALPKAELPFGAIGKYTMLIEPDTLATGLPAGTGAATLTMKSSGGVKVTGTLGDGQKFTASGPIDVNHQLAFFSAPYKGGGLIAGPMPFDLQATTPTLSSNIEWSKKTDLRATVYPAGFAKSATATGAHYIKPAKGTRVLELSSGMIRLVGGDLNFTPREQPFTLTDKNLIVVTPAVPSFKAKINTATGMINGSFRAGASGPVRKFVGALLPKENRGAGVFVGIAESGQVLLEPVP